MKRPTFTPKPAVDAAPYWFCMPGVSLIGAVSSLQLGFGSAKLADMAGIDPHLFSEELSCGYPLPRLGDDPITEPLARRSTNLELLRHPLFWLFGDILRARRVIRDEDEDGEAEDREEWSAEIALRIALSLTMAHLYDPTTGEWVDALSLIDLNLDDPWVQHRIRSWQNGTPDELLDGFNIGDTIDSAIDGEYTENLVAAGFGPVFFWASCSSVHSLEEFLSETDEFTPFEDVAGAVSVAVSVLTVDADILALISGGLDENDPNALALMQLEADFEADEPALFTSGDPRGYLVYKDRVLALARAILSDYEPRLEKMTETLVSFRQFIESGEYESDDDDD
jgi:hypothetical protein